MVMEAVKMSIQHVPSKNRISIKIKNHSVKKRQAMVRIIYGVPFIVISLVLTLIRPVELFTDWYLKFTEGSYMERSWQSPPYDLKAEVWLFNYTNVEEYLRGESSVLKVKEVGPFIYREYRTNENMTIDSEKGVIMMMPKIDLQLIREESIADPNEVMIVVPNIAVVSISTMAAEKFGYIVNSGVHLSMKAMGSKLFIKISVHEMLWGFHDPIVTVGNKLMPGWIDFDKLGVLDRIYAERFEMAEVELRQPSKMYSINTWAGSHGLTEQGYTDLNTSKPCNTIQGTYEGIMLTPNYPTDKVVPIFRKHVCRIYPFKFQKANKEQYGFTYHTYSMDDLAYSRESEYVCNNDRIPEGFTDISKCYYGFPFTISKPHFLDVDPIQRSYFDGMVNDRKRHASFLNVEPIYGAPLGLKFDVQVNMGVKMSSANPITKPLQDKMLPLTWVSLHCKEPAEQVLTLLRMRFIIGPALMMALEVLLFIFGFFSCFQGLYCIIRKRLIKEAILKQRKRSVGDKSLIPLNVSENTAFREIPINEAMSLIKVDDDKSSGGAT